MNSHISSLTSQKLSQHYKSNINLKLLVDWLALKQNDSRTLKAKVAAYSVEKSEPEMREVFKIFKSLGLGTYITGRKGGETRFEFNCSSRSLKSAAEKDIPAEPIDVKTADLDASDDEQDNVQNSLLKHSFNLRSDFMVSFNLPGDFSAKEAARFSAFISSLPISD